MKSSKYDFSHLENKTPAEILQDSLEHSSGNETIDRYSADAVLGLVTRDRPELVNSWFEIAGPEQAELDLHLEGDGVRGHSTDAFAFANFVKSIADSVKEIAKHQMGRKKHSHNLLIEGATPGSVRVLFKAPPVRRTQDTVVEETSTADSDALRRISQILNIASESERNDVLDAALAATPLSARKALRKASKVATNASWDIRGTIGQRNFGLRNTGLSHEGAAALYEALGREIEESETERITGTLDGFKSSSGVAWITPSKDSKSFAVTVGSDELLTRITDILSQGLNPPISATVKTVTTLAGTDKAGLRTSRELLSIEAREQQDPLTF